MQSLPSPSSSPSLTPTDSASNPSSRKRQRSLSMQSAASSSPKRSASEDPNQESTLQSKLLADDFTIDVDRLSDDELFQLISLPPAAFNPKVMIAVRKCSVEKLRKMPMVAGQTWYVVSKTWYRRWEKACTGQTDKDGSVSEGDVGPVDNSSILDNSGNLSTSVVEGIDVEFVPSQVWDAFTRWYGEPAHPLPRHVILRGFQRQPVLEVHIPRFRVLRVTSAHDPTEHSDDPSCYATASSQYNIRELRRRLCAVVSRDEPLQFRIYRLEGDNFQGGHCTVDQLLQAQPELIEPSDETIEISTVNSGDTFAVEVQENGKWLVDLSKISRASAGDQQSGIPQPLFSEENDFFRRIGNTVSSKVNQSSSTVKPIPTSSSLILKPTASIASTPTTRGKSLQEPGTLGLVNLGNTCFMNSALQCLSHTKELVDYFLSSLTNVFMLSFIAFARRHTAGVYQEELNPDNPLGMHGAIAESFGALLQRIWATNPVSSSYAPREFKQALQRFAPQFSGYQQHDSQELVAFLLDGLHEDLNRIKKKPYVEKPDWEGGGDRELVELGKNSWDGYLLRNDSVIVDLFQGQYRSTLVCPECQKVSITFDPFMYLTLPLPVKKKWRHDIYYVPWDVSKPHVRVPVEINRDSSFKELRQLLGRWMVAPHENLLTAEIFNHRFYKNLDDSCSCSDVGDNDTIVCFELPCPAQQSRMHKRQRDDPFIVPVFLCDLTPPRQTSGRPTNISLFGYPFIVVVSPDQARDLDAIYAAVIGRLSRWTSNANDLYRWEEGPADEMEEVPIPITGFPPLNNSITEIKENGDIVEVQEAVPEEGDIVDERSAVLQEDAEMSDVVEGVARAIGPKKGIFNFRLQINHNDLGTGYGGYGSNSQRFEPWEDRARAAHAAAPDDPHPVLLAEGDAFFCEFDENMKAFFFGENSPNWDHSLWNCWEEFIHPEYAEARNAAMEKNERGISLQDCLEEFTREEQLGEDDLWYCPVCKKHQQATKKFDLWKVPDILVVHLKRFSNSRMLRDKIDTFVDFPLEGLDLSELAGERQAVKRLRSQGVDVTEYGDVDEPLIYDLYAVDEHTGGLGGGHYRAYAYNHATEKWYHLEDSFVSAARPSDAVSPNAYLLFYQRRTNKPLGGKTHAKIEEARSKPSTYDSPIEADIPGVTQLPTPPNEIGVHRDSLTRDTLARFPGQSGLVSLSSSSRGSSPPLLDDGDPPSFDDAQFDDILQTDPLVFANKRYDFPSPSSHASPTSSNEAEADLDDERLDPWNDPFSTYKGSAPQNSMWDVTNNLGRRGHSSLPYSDDSDASPVASVQSESDPFTDANGPDDELMDKAISVQTQEIPIDDDI